MRLLTANDIENEDDDENEDDQTGEGSILANEESHRWNSGGFEWGKESEDEKDDDEDDWKTRLVERAAVLICKINGIITISMIR